MCSSYYVASIAVPKASPDRIRIGNVALPMQVLHFGAEDGAPSMVLTGLVPPLWSTLHVGARVLVAGFNVAQFTPMLLKVGTSRTAPLGKKSPMLFGRATPDR